MQTITVDLRVKQNGGLFSREIGGEQPATAVKRLSRLLLLSLLLAGIGVFFFISVDQLVGGLVLEIPGFCILS
jgi:hypothetical protein